MEKKNKKVIDVDKEAELAFEELLDLSTSELQDIVLDQETKKRTSKKSYLKVSDKDKLGQNDLFNIIQNAKKQEGIVNKEMWVDDSVDEEKAIIEKAKAKGKSEYDSDVLRELILKRQQQRRNTNGMSAFLNSVKDKKDNYDK
ncbi:hypothetical protein SCHIN_v1c05630 [Spiroplasma chinense]|uniref:Uncharacterized protein n=1 Tax=Spiroplasma chinense TaxID=216932 RepID=A0A5B9Y477_9MOLU|nr:hypothetical protein [Spiroplasma chinense]QEH61760.1 hypothetical protein SCHIN_v1c05630 [Spiroplasma chinense]